MRSCEFCVNRRKPGVCFVGLEGRRGRLEDTIRDSMSRWVNMVAITMKLTILLMAWGRQEVRVTIFFGKASAIQALNQYHIPIHDKPAPDMAQLGQTSPLQISHIPEGKECLTGTLDDLLERYLHLLHRYQCLHQDLCRDLSAVCVSLTGKTSMILLA